MSNEVGSRARPHARSRQRPQDSALLTAEQGLRAVTSDAAWALGDAERRGHLAPGTFGDVTVLSGDVTHGSPDEIRVMTVVAAIVGGIPADRSAGAAAQGARVGRSLRRHSARREDARGDLRDRRPAPYIGTPGSSGAHLERASRRRTRGRRALEPRYRAARDRLAARPSACAGRSQLTPEPERWRRTRRTASGHVRIAPIRPLSNVLLLAHDIDGDSRAASARQRAAATGRGRRDDRDHRSRPPGGGARAIARPATDRPPAGNRRSRAGRGGPEGPAGATAPASRP